MRAANSRGGNMGIYVVHWNYGRIHNDYVHMVRGPDTMGKVFKTDELLRFLRGKRWRYAV